MRPGKQKALEALWRLKNLVEDGAMHVIVALDEVEASDEVDALRKDAHGLRSELTATQTKLSVSREATQNALAAALEGKEREASLEKRIYELEKGNDGAHKEWRRLRDDLDTLYLERARVERAFFELADGVRVVAEEAGSRAFERHRDSLYATLRAHVAGVFDPKGDKFRVFGLLRCSWCTKETSSTAACEGDFCSPFCLREAQRYAVKPKRKKAP